jgi:peptidoglycan/xylan/chitin deacetylase (PgdA/CDA1 family)
MKPGSLPILTYHAIDSSGAVTATEPSRFADTLDALLGAGFRAIDLGRWIEANRPPVENGFAITFDDGLRSILGLADRLSRLEIPATIFLVANRIGLDNTWPGQRSNIPVARLLGRNDLETLAKLGFRFGSHGCTHLGFDRLSTRDLKNELIDSRDRIEQVIGSPCRLLAYPYGSTNPRVRTAASRVYDAACGTRLAYASASDHLYDLARLDAYYLRSPQAVDRLIAGRWNGRLAVRRALRAVRATVERVGLL